MSPPETDTDEPISINTSSQPIVLAAKPTLKYLAMCDEINAWLRKDSPEVFYTPGLSVSLQHLSSVTRRGGPLHSRPHSPVGSISSGSTISRSVWEHGIVLRTCQENVGSGDGDGRGGGCYKLVQNRRKKCNGKRHHRERHGVRTQNRQHVVCDIFSKISVFLIAL